MYPFFNSFYRDYIRSYIVVDILDINLWKAAIFPGWNYLLKWLYAKMHMVSIKKPLRCQTKLWTFNLKGQTWKAANFRFLSSLRVWNWRDINNSIIMRRCVNF